MYYACLCGGQVGLLHQADKRRTPEAISCSRRPIYRACKVKLGFLVTRQPVSGPVRWHCGCADGTRASTPGSVDNRVLASSNNVCHGDWSIRKEQHVSATLHAWQHESHANSREPRIKSIRSRRCAMPVTCKKSNRRKEDS